MFTTDDVIEVTHFQSMGGQQILNVFHWQLAAGSPASGPTQLLALATATGLRFGDVFPIQSDQWLYVGTRARVIVGKINVDEIAGTGQLVYGDQVEIASVPVIAGSLAGDRLPTYAAVRALLRTDRAGRRYRGAKRIAGIIEDNTLNDQVVPLVLGSYQAWLDLYVADFSIPLVGPTFESKVFSKKDFFQTPAVTSPGAFTGKILTTLCRTALGTQNTRKQPAALFFP